MRIDRTRNKQRLAHINFKLYGGKVDYLFGLVTQTASLVGASGVSDANNGGKLAVLPAPHSKQKPHDIRLLLPP